MLNSVLLSALILAFQTEKAPVSDQGAARPAFSSDAAFVFRDPAGMWTETVEFDLTVDEDRPLAEEGRFETFYTVRRSRLADDGTLTYATTDSRECQVVTDVLARIVSLPAPRTVLPGFSDPIDQATSSNAVLHAPVSELWLHASLDARSPTRIRLTSVWGLVSDLATDARKMLEPCWRSSDG